MFDTDAVAGISVGPPRDIARRKDTWHAGFEIGVDDDAAVDLEARLLGQFEARFYANTDHDEVGFERASALEADLAAVDRRHAILQMKDDVMLLVEGTHEVAHVGPQDALHRPLLGRDHMHLDATLAQ